MAGFVGIPMIGVISMAKTAKKPKLTDADRHERFKEMARQVGASEDPKAFDQAFKKVAKPAPKKRAR
jgi:hypothetical protein